MLPVNAELLDELDIVVLQGFHVLLLAEKFFVNICQHLPEGDCKPPQFILASEKFLVWREKFRKKFLLGLPGFPPGIMAPESEGIFIQKSRKHFLYLCEGFPKEYLQEKQKQREKKPCEKDKGVEEGFAKGQDFLPHRREGNIDFRPSQEIPVVKKAVVDGVDFSRKGGAEFEKIRYGKKPLK